MLWVAEKSMQRGEWHWLRPCPIQGAVGQGLGGQGTAGALHAGVLHDLMSPPRVPSEDDPGPQNSVLPPLPLQTWAGGLS